MHVFIKHLAINLTYVKLILTLHNNLIVGIILTNTKIIMSNLIFTCISIIYPEKIFGGKGQNLVKSSSFNKEEMLYKTTLKFFITCIWNCQSVDNSENLKLILP